MQNASVWNTTDSEEHEDHHGDDHHGHAHTHLAHIHDVSLKIIYIIIGTVGVVNNLFVLLVFVLFIKITAKVGQICRTWSCAKRKEQL